jgi:hypothetical protein
MRVCATLSHSAEECGAFADRTTMFCQLFQACIINTRLEMMKLLVNAGGDVNAVDNDLRTPLFYT